MAWRTRLAQLIPPLLFAAALWIIWRELHHIHFHDVREAMNRLPPSRIAGALALTALNYVILIGYDWLAIRAVGRRLPWPKVALASFAGFAVSYNVNAVLGGTAIRYRYYSQWGLTALELFRLLVMIGVTFWMGVLSLAGVLLVTQPVAAASRYHLGSNTLFWLGCGLIAVTLGYIGLVAWRKQPLRIRGMEFVLPGLRATLEQLLVAAVDLSIAGGVLYVLISDQLSLGYLQFLTIYLLAIVVVLLTHVPGGVGVFELVVIGLSGASATPELVAALVVFRIIYYLGPLVAALCLMAGYELAQNRHLFTAKVGQRSAQAWDQLRQWWPSLVPSLMAVGVFMAGALLLISGATPAEHQRLRWMHEYIPLPLLEISHFMGSLVGVALLLLAHGLQRRLDTAYWATSGLLVSGICFSLLKGWDFEEAGFLALVLVTLAPCHAAFYRRGRLLGQSVPIAWFGPALLVVACSIWIGLFVNKHVEYRDQLWWKFAFDSDAPRILRAGVGVVVSLLIFGIVQLLTPHAPRPAPPSEAELQRAGELADASPRTSAQLVRLRDKQLLFGEDQRAMIMYARQGRSWVAMGDPVGPLDSWNELVWKYRELVDRFGGWPVFYQVGVEGLTVYLDQGLTLLKIGEEARVPLGDFGLDGAKRRGLRQTVNRMRREDVTFEIAPRESLAQHLPRLQVISDAWLMDKRAGEKGFSLGFFDPTYLSHYPLAIARQAGEIVAFANLWSGADKEELSIDLMRYVPEAPASVMEYLFIELMLWGKVEGYRWFNLGMAPLSGIEARKLAPVWNRLSNLVFRHGEHFYSFEGLRQYKDKFDPTWFPKYIALPGGVALPLILADLTRLIARGRD